MIELDIKPYCQNCNRFEAAVQRQTLYGGVSAITREEIYICETRVKCQHRGECSQLFRYLQDEFERSK